MLPVTVLIHENEELVFEKRLALAGPLEVGRQRASEPPPYAYHPGKPDRLVLFHADDLYNNPRQNIVEPVDIYEVRPFDESLVDLFRGSTEALDAIADQRLQIVFEASAPTHQSAYTNRSPDEAICNP